MTEQINLTLKDCISRILNEKNIAITNSFINNILTKYGILYKISNLELFQRAMIHDSYLNRTSVTSKITNLLKDITPIQDENTAFPLQNNSYETLEFLGDAVIHNILSTYLYKRYPEKDEGFLSRLRIKIEEEKTLTKFGRKLGLSKYIVIARNLEVANARNLNKTILCDVFEAFMGALSLEAGYKICYDFLIKFIDIELDFAKLIMTEDNYKETLMKYYHEQGVKTTPTYHLLKIIDDDSKKKYIIQVKDGNGNIVGTGIDTIKKESSKKAAKDALISLGVLKDIPNNDNDDENDYYGELSD